MVAHIHDVELLAEIEEVRARWNDVGGSVLRLFQNNFVPAPDAELADYNEADFDGYAEIDLAGEWAEPVYVMAGWYKMETPEFTIDPPGMGAAQTIYGAYIVHDGGVVQSKRFDAPIVMEVGALPWKIRARYDKKSESIL